MFRYLVSMAVMLGLTQAAFDIRDYGAVAGKTSLDIEKKNA